MENLIDAALQEVREGMVENEEDSVDFLREGASSLGLDTVSPAFAG